MKNGLLAIDTSTPRFSAALALNDGRIFESRGGAEAKHATDLIPVIQDLLLQGSISSVNLGAIAVGLGPGSYTGLRIGLIAAKTLAYALECRLIGLDSLEIVARNAPRRAARLSIVADAQRGDLFVADFERADPESRLVRRGPTRVESASDWLSRLTEETFVLGPALARATFSLPAGVGRAKPEDGLPLPAGLIESALEAYDSGRADDVWNLEPIYLRRSAAEDKKDGSVNAIGSTRTGETRTAP